MRTGLLLAAVFAFVCAGCTLDPAPSKTPTEPMPTDGLNQVVLSVPNMTCEGCPVIVAEKLSTLPWIAPESITADRKLRQVKFTVKDRTAFNLDAVKDAVGDRYADGMKLLTAPTDK
jgi:copper chaperone CopZ